MNPQLLKSVLPIVIVAIVMIFRLRSMSKERPLDPGKLWIAPAILVGIAAAALSTAPLTPAGLAIGFAALVIGGLVGWQRGKLIHIKRDPASGTLVQRASPAAMVMLLAIIAIRMAIRENFGATPDAQGHMAGQALIATDALLLFAVGLVVMTHAEMILRVRRIRAGEEQPA